MTCRNTSKAQSGQALTESILIIGAVAALPSLLTLVSANLERRHSDATAVLNIRMQGVFSDHTLRTKADWRRKQEALARLSADIVDYSLNTELKKTVFPGQLAQPSARSEVRQLSGAGSFSSKCNAEYSVHRSKSGEYTFNSCAPVTAYHSEDLNAHTRRDAANSPGLKNAESSVATEADIAPLFAGDFYHNPDWPWRSRVLRHASQLLSVRPEALLPYQKPHWRRQEFRVRDCLFNYPAAHSTCSPPSATGTLYDILYQTAWQTFAAQMALCMAEISRAPMLRDCPMTKTAVKSAFLGFKSVVEIGGAAVVAREAQLRLELSSSLAIDNIPPLR